MFLLAEVTILDKANLTTRDNINGNILRMPLAGTSSNLRYNLAAVIYFGQDNVAPRPTTFHTIIIMRSGGYYSHYDRRQLLVYDNRSSDGKFVALEPTNDEGSFPLVYTSSVTPMDRFFATHLIFVKVE